MEPDVVGQAVLDQILQHSRHSRRSRGSRVRAAAAAAEQNREGGSGVPRRAGTESTAQHCIVRWHACLQFNRPPLLTSPRSRTCPRPAGQGRRERQRRGAVSCGRRQAAAGGGSGDGAAAVLCRIGRPPCAFRHPARRAQCSRGSSRRHARRPTCGSPAPTVPLDTLAHHVQQPVLRARAVAPGRKVKHHDRRPNAAARMSPPLGAQESVIRRLRYCQPCCMCQL